MTVQKIIDTYNYSVVTGCRLTKKASDDLYEAIHAHIDMKAKDTLDPNKSNMAPVFFINEGPIPKDFLTFTGYRPTTKILYDNYCELELLRILYLLHPNKSELNDLLQSARHRIRATCFGNFCATGECFEISIMALRFIATVFPEEQSWIDMYVGNIAHTIFKQDRRISTRTELLFCQVLSELRREKDGLIMDEILGFIDVDHLHHVSKVSDAVNACILYSSLRRTVLAS